MAGDWIKMREALHEDPAVLSMANRLSTRPEHVVGYCHRFWSWVSRNCHDGTVTGVTIEALEGVLNLPGFLVMMCEVGWLTYRTDGGQHLIEIPKFDRHLSQSAKTRGLNAERQRNVRNATVTDSSQKLRDKTTTREEKRREENTSAPLPPPRVDVLSTGVDAADPEWEAVVVALHGVGMTRSQSATSKARANGCSPGAVMELLAHYRSRIPAWTPGALHDRILELRPGQDPTTLWPPPSPAAKAVEKSAERAAAADKCDAQRKSDAAALAADQANRDRLEADHGATVDAMDRHAMEAAMSERLPGWRRLYSLKNTGKLLERNGAVRFELLCHCDSQAVPAR